MKPRLLVLVCSAGAVAALGSCNAVWGIDSLDYGAGIAAGGEAAGSGAQPGGNGGTAAGGGGTAAGGGAGAHGGHGGSTSTECAPDHECVPDPGSNVLVRRMPAGSACPAQWGTGLALYDGVDTGCKQCSCATPLGGSCGLSVRSYATNLCSNADHQYDFVDGHCLGTASLSQYWEFTPTQDEGGCEASVGAGAPLDPAVPLCQLTGEKVTGCGQNEACVPKAPDPFGAACVLVDGANASCPAGYSAVSSYYEQANDHRSCTCACEPASGAICAGQKSLQFLASGGCSGGTVGTVSVQDTCTLVSAAQVSLSIHAGNWTPGSCAFKPDASGSVAFSVPVTLCCVP